MDDLKRCTMCDNYFPSTEEYFYKTSWGLSSWCKKCKSDYAIKWQNNNRERTNEKDRKQYSRPERKEQIKINNKKNKENGNLAKWLASENGKASIKKGNQKHYSNKKHSVSSSEWEECKKYFNYCCAYCGLSIEEHYRLYKQDFHKEHVNNDGLNTIDNCVPSCRNCNSSKHKFDLEFWYRQQVFFSEEKLSLIYNWLDKFTP